MDSKPKNREWVKNAAIVFLAVLLVLTFFSNTIMNRALPEVATQYVTDGTITAKVRGTGTVTANGSHQVKAEDTREIRAVMIKTGQKVEAGDVLFVLGGGESSELEEAQEQLRQLQLSYQRTALSGSSASYESDQRKVDAAKETADEAEAVFNAIREQTMSSEAVQELQRQLNAKQHELEEATVVRDAYKSAYDELVSGARTELEQKESQRLQAKQAVIQYYEEQIGDVAPEETEGDAVEVQEDKKPKDEDLNNPAKKVKELEEAGVIGREMELWVALRDADEEVKSANAALAAISPAQLDEAQANVDALQKAVDDIQTQIDNILNADPSSVAYREAKAAYEQAYADYLDLKEALEQRKAADARSNALIGIELADLNTKIEQQKKRVAELSGGEENQILANVSGTVQSVECTSGDVKAKDEVLCVIEVPDMGYTLSFSVTNEQATRLKVGDSATVSNYYWGSKIVATLESIRVDPRNPQTNKVLTFDVSGDVNAGTELTISVGQRSANYDTVVPNSAIHSDSNGSFVYKIEAKSSPLGNRYIARRVAVEILAQDDSNAAVTGDFSWGDYVITTSNAPFKNGDMVRLAD